MTIFRRWSPNEDVECRCARQKSRFSTNIWLSDRWLVKCEQQLRWPTVQFTEQTATHHWSCLSQPAWTTYEEKRTKVVRSGKSEAEVAKIEDCARSIVLLKLTTDRHEASRGLSATAGLLVHTPWYITREMVSIITARCYASAVYAVMQRPSVCQSVCHVRGSRQNE